MLSVTMFALAMVSGVVFGVDDDCDDNRLACTQSVVELKLRTTVLGASAGERVDGYYVRHENGNVRIDLDDGSDLFDDDSTWQWSDGCGSPLNDKVKCDYVSFEATTAGYSNYYLRHQFLDVKIHEYVDENDWVFREDASFKMVQPALNGESGDCYSFETTIEDGNGGRTAGYYLRHQYGNVIISPYDANDDVFLHDATFCIEWH